MLTTAIPRVLLLCATKSKLLFTLLHVYTTNSRLSFLLNLCQEVDRKATKRKSNADDAGRRKRMCPMVAHDAEGGISCGSVLGVRRMSARLRGKVWIY